MAIVIHTGPVNPAQVIAALGSTGCTVRDNFAKGTYEVDVDGFDAAAITNALAAITYDPTIKTAAPPA